ncbi:MAG: putative selenate reductase subunit YgfK [Ignavibacteria bacterium RIFOXYB2_FULL_35_12]|nr:MAG: putative selenate reductase subunit YgfK [Ignavibacteria bacterium GWA2_36_19]OGU52826.1 MAG: putative selenate reductase subunit YgfK [Ignavibacteria bacterium GWC2_35_8]OGU62434.1 MAG: putative selenate reductase subunit YgfK [Ignavibacteria bacterium GWF2_35_20]OGU79026.1 MAG: putative selenate reductase subunit YgfK [Ignavibacteria bacterium RIFOXYA2_FULL_35_9]OGU87433.1 MAG: putative selenate reductase subunit YgfK [Ignavibacteria bacterium RIFOXYA12_FULL_35_25]OGU90088.1 MAG: put
MAERMSTIGFDHLLKWIFSEYAQEDSIFGIPSIDFLSLKKISSLHFLDEQLDLPIGPAAGPHTQLSQNIVASYLAGGRFFELKTVQVKDDLNIDKPCIDAQDECYNVEWSQELRLEESLDEYLKAWMILHLLKQLLYPDSSSPRGFIFNMSVGYNLEGIKGDKMQTFINSLIDATENPSFKIYQDKMLKFIESDRFAEILSRKFPQSLDVKPKLNDTIKNISSKISNSVTLSTMHGCPADEIEVITKYLLEEKKLHTYVKLNPTLLGYEKVHEILQILGFKNVELDEHSFKSDLKFESAVSIISRLQDFAGNINRRFGVKLSNTLPVKNRKNMLAGDEMYMSGRSLFPLTINAAWKLAEALNGNLSISYSGGAAVYNTPVILKCGIYPVTYATDLLKPGGYRRLNQIGRNITESFQTDFTSRKINLENLKKLADDSLINSHYKKEIRLVESIKIPTKLETFNCFTAPCVVACPIHQDVPEYVKLIEGERYREAYEVIISKNALPSITAHICDHQCQFHCTRWDYDESVKIRDLKKIAVEKGREEFLAHYKKDLKKSNEIKCAVIGAGPSGLAASYFLAQAGFDVTVFEKHDKAGGVVQNIIPDFRLPQSAIDNDVEFIKQLGVKFEFNVDPNFSVEELKQKGFKYVYIAIGAGKSTELNLNGEAKNVINALDFLWKYHHKDKIALGKSVAVIGGGNSAMDAARAAKRIDGVDKVYILYRRTKEFMPADKEEFDNTIEDGVVFKELLLPIEFDGKILRSQKMKLGEIGSDGRRNVVSIGNEFEEHKIDFIISAIGEKVDLDILGQNQISINKYGKAETNIATNETLLENVFIGGDALRGPSTVVESIADGKKAAEAIIKKEKLDIIFDKSFQHLFDKEQRKKRIAAQKGNIFSLTQISNLESTRCLECNFICNKCVDVCPNRANILITIDGDYFKDVNQILHIDWMCNECGNCETFCPHAGSPYKDKITLFRNEYEFYHSQKDGFYILKRNGEIELVSRIDSKIEKMKFYNNGERLDYDKDKDEERIRFTKLAGKILSDYHYLLS